MRRFSPPVSSTVSSFGIRRNPCTDPSTRTTCRPGGSATVAGASSTKRPSTNTCASESELTVSVASVAGLSSRSRIGRARFGEASRVAAGTAGVGVGDNIGLMCRNHRGFIDAVIAASKIGASTLFLNTAFSGPQLADVAQREKPKALIYDHEFEGLIHDASRRRKRFIAWHDPEDGKPGDPRLEDLIQGGDTSNLDAPSERGKAIILTSGTTGTPKTRIAGGMHLPQPVTAA